MSSPQSVILVFQLPSGAPLANGTVTFQLSSDMVVDSLQISAGRVVSGNLDDTGAITVALWPNTGGTVYFVKASTADGALAYDSQLTVTEVDELLQEDDVSLFLLEGSTMASILLET